jgi:16S rRNA (cytidine1402-2'-O)-methyltransferase
MGKLYVVATPIGNLEDVSLRAIRTLREVDLVAAEDTRTAHILLAKYGITAKLLSYTDHNKSRRIPEVLNYLNAGDVALVTDAGTPAISDPGVDLVAAAREAGYEVVAVPGASAVIAALSIAGLPTTSFRFIGFLPRTPGDLRRLMAEQASSPETLVAFESPRRLRRSLELIAAALPERRIAVCRELTKLHEEVFVGTASEAVAYFQEPRGEIVLVITGSSDKVVTSDADELGIRKEVEEMRRIGLTRVQATALLALRGVSRRRAYEMWLDADQP